MSSLNRILSILRTARVKGVTVEKIRVAADVYDEIAEHFWSTRPFYAINNLGELNDLTLFGTPIHVDHLLAAGVFEVT